MEMFFNENLGSLDQIFGTEWANVIRGFYEGLKENDVDMIKYWVNYRDGEQNTLLHVLPLRRYDHQLLKTMELFIRHGGDVNAREEKGFTPLHFTNHPASIRMLIKYGANVNAINDFNESILDIFIGILPKRIISGSAFLSGLDILLDSGAKSSNEDKSFLRMYFHLLMEKKINHTPTIVRHVVALCIEKGFNINSINIAYETILHMVVERDEIAYTELLIEHGADINLLNINGCTTLHLAVHRTNFKIVELLIINSGADVNARNERNCSPLHFLLNCKNQIESVRIAELLINRGCDINALSDSGYSILHLAVMSKNKELITFLLDNGANPNIKNINGQSPLDIVKTDIEFLKRIGAANEEIDEYSILNIFNRNIEEEVSNLLKDIVYQVVSVNKKQSSLEKK